MTAALIHIGMPKTGTSSIQSWLTQNADALAQRGVAYRRAPAEGAPKNPSQTEMLATAYEALGRVMPHSQLTRQLGFATPAGQTAVVEAFTAAQRDAIGGDIRTLVLSSENLSTHLDDAERIGGLDAWARGLADEVRYVVYLRRQEDYLASRYFQGLRAGRTMSLRAFIARNLTLDYAAFVDLWRGVVGPRLTVRLLEPDALRDGDLVADFAALLGVDPDGLIRPERANASLSAAAAEFMRAMNAQMPSGRGAVGRDPVSIGLEHLLREADDGAGPRIAPGPAQLREIRDANAASNERLRRAEFPDRSELFPDRPPPDAAGGVPSLPQQVARLGLRLLDRMGDP
ncbi:MAG: hypothetical protein ACU0BF_04015 [Paracoccaceae bacterium]